jgi:hypothetical protein
MDIIARIVSILTFVITGVLAYYLAKVYGDVAGTKLAIEFEKQQAAESQERIEKGALASLEGELRRSKALCVHNASLKTQSTAPFIHFPTTVAMRITFEERHKYPRLEGLLGDLEAYTMGLLHINQLMDLHDLLWISPVPATGVDEGAQSRRGKLQHQIANLCAGDEELKGIGPENFVVLPSFIDHLLKSVERIKTSGTEE